MKVNDTKTEYMIIPQPSRQYGHSERTQTQKNCTIHTDEWWAIRVELCSQGVSSMLPYYYRTTLKHINWFNSDFVLSSNGAFCKFSIYSLFSKIKCIFGVIVSEARSSQKLFLNFVLIFPWKSIHSAFQRNQPFEIRTRNVFLAML